MMFKLVDVKREVEYVEFGTCELCFNTGALEVVSYIIEGEDGVKRELENGEWRWGEYYYYVDSEVRNVVEFASFLSRQRYYGDKDCDKGIAIWFFEVLNFYVSSAQNP